MAYHCWTDLIDPGMQAAASGYVQAAYASNGLPATRSPAATSIALGLPSSGLALLRKWTERYHPLI